MPHAHRRANSLLFSAGGMLVVLALSISSAFAQSTQPAESPAAAAAAAAARGPDENQPIVRSGHEPGAPGDAAHRPAESRSASTAPSLDVSRVAMSLGIVLVLIFALKWSAKRLFPGQVGVKSSRAAIEVLSRSPLSARQQFLLVRVGKRLVVVADSGGAMSAICQISDSDEVAEMLGQLRSEPRSGRSAGESIGKSFLTLFGRKRESFEQNDLSGDASAIETAEAEADASDQRAESDEIEVGMTRQEIGGLMEKVRLLSRQFKR